MNDLCVCGHVADEHDWTSLAPCQVDGCSCGGFEPEIDGGEDEA